MRARRPLLLVLGGALTAGCGDRTGLLVSVPSDAAIDATLDATLDATADMAVDSPADVAIDAPIDVVEEPKPCLTDADCADGRYCTASARCDPTIGCVLTPRSCDDGIACTDDACDEKHQRCTHAPDDTKCPETELCSPSRDCDAFVYGVASDGNLYEVRVPSGALFTVGAPAIFASDIALTEDSSLYATDTYVLYTLSRLDGTSTPVASILPLNMYNGLGTFPPASLYATADAPQIFGVDSTNGTSTIAASLPAGFRSSGDLTTAGGQFLVTLTPNTGTTTDTLAVVDLAGQATTPIGDTGFRCIWGLATLGTTVYGLTCEGRVLTIDPGSGQSQSVAKVAPAFFGAAGR